MSDDCIYNLDSLPPDVSGCMLTVGNFDGVHLGHQRIVRTARLLGDARGAAVVAMTFEPPPDRIVRPADAPQRITPAAQKVRLLRDAGCDRVVVVKADREFLAISADDFIEKIIVGLFAPSCVIEGPNFFFGHKRAGNVETLAAASSKAGFELHVVEPVRLEFDEGVKRVSSTLIRNLVAQGRLEDARRCLGRDFTIYGKVVAGTGRGGKLLGFPTINLDVGEQVWLGDGVYAGRADIEGRQYDAAVSVGLNPTLGGCGRSIEAHLLDVEGDFTGCEVTLQLVQRIASQKRLDSPEALKAQIAKDVQRVREILR